MNVAEAQEIVQQQIEREVIKIVTACFAKFKIELLARASNGTVRVADIEEVLQPYEDVAGS